MTTKKPEIIAAVDLGSNSFHMIVAEVVNGQVHIIDRMKEMVRLAAGLDENNNVTEEAAEKAINCLRKFGERLRDIPKKKVRTVGTNTLRRAKNTRKFLKSLEDALGHRIKIIPGHEEARIIYLGVCHGITQNDNQRLVIDIGGGSTEFIIGQQFQPLLLESLYMGCVGVSQRFFSDGKITQSRMQKAILACKQELEPIALNYKKQAWDIAIGSSGTIQAITNLSLEQGWSHDGITQDSLKSIRKILIDLKHTDQINFESVSKERAPVFPGGVAILSAAFEALDIKKMSCSESALREGLLYELLGNDENHDIQSSTINALQQRYNIDLKQASRVNSTITVLYELVKKQWKIDQQESYDLLSWAGKLHEIGLTISHNQYHKHSAYLLEHVDMPGFSNQEQKMLAILVANHRRKLNIAGYDLFLKKTQKKLLRLTTLLRIAVLLHRGRADQTLPELKAKAHSNNLHIRFPKEWLANHSLSEADLANEANYLSTMQIQLTFE